VVKNTIAQVGIPNLSPYLELMNNSNKTITDSFINLGAAGDSYNKIQSDRYNNPLIDRLKRASSQQEANSIISSVDSNMANQTLRDAITGKIQETNKLNDKFKELQLANQYDPNDPNTVASLTNALTNTTDPTTRVALQTQLNTATNNSRTLDKTRRNMVTNDQIRNDFVDGRNDTINPNNLNTETLKYYGTASDNLFKGNQTNKRNITNFNVQDQIQQLSLKGDFEGLTQLANEYIKTANANNPVDPTILKAISDGKLLATKRANAKSFLSGIGGTQPVNSTGLNTSPKFGLTKSESSGNYAAVNESNPNPGKNAYGIGQFTPNRLADFKHIPELQKLIVPQSNGKGFQFKDEASKQTFLEDTKLQDKVFDTQLADIQNKVISDPFYENLLGKNVTIDGKTVQITPNVITWASHLGGYDGAKNFFRTGTNPNDGNTSITDYLIKGAIDEGQNVNGQQQTQTTNNQGNVVGNVQGQIEPGNIDLANRPQVKLPDGSIATVRSASFNFGGKKVLLPTVSPDGKLLTNDEAVELYKQTGQHLGIFNNTKDATTYGNNLHKAQEEFYVSKPDLSQSPTIGLNFNRSNSKINNLLQSNVNEFANLPIEEQGVAGEKLKKEITKIRSKDITEQLSEIVDTESELDRDIKLNNLDQKFTPKELNEIRANTLAIIKNKKFEPNNLPTDVQSVVNEAEAKITNANKILTDNANIANQKINDTVQQKLDDPKVINKGSKVVELLGSRNNAVTVDDIDTYANTLRSEIDNSDQYTDAQIYGAVYHSLSKQKDGETFGFLNSNEPFFDGSKDFSLKLAKEKLNDYTNSSNAKTKATEDTIKLTNTLKVMKDFETKQKDILTDLSLLNKDPKTNAKLIQQKTKELNNLSNEVSDFIQTPNNTDQNKVKKYSQNYFDISDKITTSNAEPKVVKTEGTSKIKNKVLELSKLVPQKVFTKYVKESDGNKVLAMAKLVNDSNNILNIDRSAELQLQIPNKNRNVLTRLKNKVFGEKQIPLEKPLLVPKLLNTEVFSSSYPYIKNKTLVTNEKVYNSDLDDKTINYLSSILKQNNIKEEGIALKKEKNAINKEIEKINNQNKSK
jgi:hypothetical protein